MSKTLPTVAIIGRANAGKSSLFNRMVGWQQAIVAREAGTTRDSVIAKVEYRRKAANSQPSSSEGSVFPTELGQDSSSLRPSVPEGGDGSESAVKSRYEKSHFWLVDTAGLKDAQDEFEATIQEQIIEAVDAADAIIVVADATEYPDDDLRRVAKTALKSKKPVVLALNKTDLGEALPSEEYQRLGIKPIIRTSAEHKIGIGNLFDHLSTILPAARQPEADNILRIALIGRPNVGKSNLFNRLAGKQQALVANVAGTTRDLGRTRVTYHQQVIELIDTAGIRRPGKQEQGIEKFSVLRTLSAIEEADICLLLTEASEVATALDQKLAGLIDEAGKGMVIVVSKWDAVEGKDAYTRDRMAPRIARAFDFVPWAPLIFTSAVTGHNVTKLYDLALEIRDRRLQQPKTRELNKLLQAAIQKHPPAGLKNTHPRLRYMVHTDTTPPWFVIYGSNLKFVHWSYKRYLERLVREKFNYSGTPIKFSFRDEKQIKSNKERIAKGLEPVTKAYKQAKNNPEDIK